LGRGLLPAMPNRKASRDAASSRSGKGGVPFIVFTTAASSAENRKRSLFWPSAGGATFALVLLFVRPRKQKDLVALIGLLLLFVSTGLVACGGGFTALSGVLK